MNDMSEAAIITLSEIKESKNPTEYLSNRFERCTSEQKEELRSILRELSRLGCIKIMWADNSPWYVDVDYSLIDTILNRATELEEGKSSITIGNNNTIRNSVISSGNVQLNGSSPVNKSLSEKHPVIVTVLISLGVGMLLMFSFWERIISYIENLF